jgi:hypothetical protein
MKTKKAFELSRSQQRELHNILVKIWGDYYEDMPELADGVSLAKQWQARFDKWENKVCAAIEDGMPVVPSSVKGK